MALNAVLLLQICILVVMLLHLRCAGPTKTAATVLAVKSLILAMTIFRLLALHELRFGAIYVMVSAVLAVGYLVALDARSIYDCQTITPRTLWTTAILSMLLYLAAGICHHRFDR
jgi:hypothetical protein